MKIEDLVIREDRKTLSNGIKIYNIINAFLNEIKEFEKSLNLSDQMNQSKALTLGRDAGRNPQKEKGERNGILDKRS